MVPDDGAVRLQASGIVLDAPDVAGVLYPTLAGGHKAKRLFLTQAPLFEGAAGLFADHGLLPWSVETR